MKGNIKKWFFITLWSAAGALGVLLLGAAISHRNNKTCQGYRIDIAGGTMTTATEAAPDSPFLERKEIEMLLLNAGAAHWQGRHIMTFDLKRMEAALEKNPWIQDAELFFDNNGILRVNVMERQPVARIFTPGGYSFYIDSTAFPLPVAGRLPARLPVFTGFPDLKGKWHGADSLLAGQVRLISMYLLGNPLWMSQIAQVDITPEKTFMMTPTVGDHMIEFGDATDLEQKFHRLFIFYREVLSRAGLDKYARIDVRYAGQVIATKKGQEGMHTDSVLGMRNIRQLIHAAQQLQPDTLRQQNMRPLEHNSMTEQSLTELDLIPSRNDSVQQPSPHTQQPVIHDHRH
ncbi:MAG: FtsQ-type POTRA domain-containing protein [Bacteroidota bacterium]|nr:FtsQ-type POTRA domain-containing protein [Bacteroidota bacterium]